MMLKKLSLLLCLSVLSLVSAAQPTFAVNNNEKRYQEVSDWMLHRDYAMAYPVLKDMERELKGIDRTNMSYMYDDVQAWLIICRLKLMQEIGAEDAEHYLASAARDIRKHQVAFHLAHYYFVNEDYESASNSFAIVKFDNLTNDDIAAAKYERAYSLLMLKHPDLAKPLFNEVTQLKGTPYLQAASYYYGYTSFLDKEWTVALEAFRSVANDPVYGQSAPFYIAQIHYFLGNKEQALTYGDSSLSAQLGGAYRKELELLVGQLYFEKKAYREALPLLVDYTATSEKISQQVLYQLSYSYFKTGNKTKAIQGFRQLSSDKDSLGQQSMFILGDLYLQQNDKANARSAFHFCATNSSDKNQQRISRLNYAKLSYELGYQDQALAETKRYINDYSNFADDNAGENLFGHVGEARELLMSMMANTNNYDEGLALYKAQTQTTPEAKKVYARLLYGKAIQQVNDQQLSDADAGFAEVIQLNSAPGLVPYASFWRGEIAYRQKRYEEAIRFLTTYINAKVPSQSEANSTNANYNLGYSYFQKGDYSSALRHFESIATTVRPVNSVMEQDAYVRSADCHFMLKDFAKANSMYESVSKSGTAQSDYALYQMAVIAGIKKPMEKIRLLRQLITQYASSSLALEATVQLSLTYVDEQQFKEALPLLNEIAANDKAAAYWPQVYYNQGLCAFNINENQKALTAFRFLLKNYPQSSEATQSCSMIRDIFVEEGNPDAYVELMKENGIIVQVSEADSLSYESASIKYEAGDCKTALSAFNNYMMRYPSGKYVLEANYRSALCALQLKDTASALKHFDAVNSKGASKYFEPATLEAARICYFDKKEYASAKKYFESLLTAAVNAENRLEAMRGLVRCYYQLKEYGAANSVATELLGNKGVSQDDKAIAYLVKGRSNELVGDTAAAIMSFKQVVALNKSSWGAEARYALAANLLVQHDLEGAERAAMSVIKETGSYESWVIKSYILLGDIFVQQKDYFNAKATYESVASNANIPEFKTIAQQKLDQVVLLEKQQSKISKP